MNGSRPAEGEAVTCQVFDTYADELALGLLDEPLRTALLGHAGRCSACRSLLDELAAVGDSLLLAAPELEPPAGFEGRVLDRLPAAAGRDEPGGPAELPAQARSRRPVGGRRWLVGAAIVLAAGAAATGALLVGNDRNAVQEAGAIVTASGQQVGEIRLLTDPVPHLLITVPNPQGAPGVRVCELQRPDGSWVRVGSWEAVDLAS
ncbi:MAG: hypothetical protein OEW29_11425, partial [Acidimicrobiia bacterium]|nr:hypothetical protein [Acidimicrobiia bacterium]